MAAKHSSFPPSVVVFNIILHAVSLIVQSINPVTQNECIANFNVYIYIYIHCMYKKPSQKTKYGNSHFSHAHSNGSNVFFFWPRALLLQNQTEMSVCSVKA